MYSIVYCTCTHVYISIGIKGCVLAPTIYNMKLYRSGGVPAKRDDRFARTMSKYCSLILHHDLLYSEVKAIQLSQKSSVRSLKQEYYSKCSTDLRHHLDSLLRLALDLAVEKGASTWLTALPLDEYGFALHYINLPFKMSLPCVMAGFPRSRASHTVLVELFLLNMPYLVLKVGYLLFDTRK